ncbi:hypothetical protein GCM10020001_015710 [Nonomuraea salmonea]
MSTPASRTPASRHHKRPRGEGQWALGYREPLNKNEESKKNDDGLNVRQRIIDIYSKRGFDSIDPADLRGRMRWYGLYTQRKPGIDGGKTAILEPEELDDRYFMLRVRIDGGQLDLAQLRTIADISNEYARGTADITDRQNIQLHWVEIESVPDIWERLEAVGLSTTEACGDTPRVIMGCPLAGIDTDEVLDASDQIKEIYDRVVGNPAYSNLPRKFKTALSGCPAHCTVHEINDVAFVGVVNERGEAGYDLWVGGGLSTNPMLGKRLGVFVSPEKAADVHEGVVGIFRDYGYRRLRHRARIKFLVNDWGGRRSSGRSWRPNTSKRRCPTGPRPSSRATAGATTSASSRRRTATSTSASRPRWAGSTATSCGSSPTSPSATAPTGCAPPSSRRWSSSTSRPSGSSPSWPSWRPTTCRSTRPRSAARRWPAPASNTASSPSSRPRPPRWT